MQPIAKQFLKDKEESGFTFDALRFTPKDSFVFYFFFLFFPSIFLFEWGRPKMKSKSSAPLCAIFFGECRMFTVQQGCIHSPQSRTGGPGQYGKKRSFQKSF